MCFTKISRTKNTPRVCFLGGVTGVFDLSDLVKLLEHENARDICAISVPPQFRYVDHMVIVSGRSTKHLKAIAAAVKWFVSVSKSCSCAFVQK